MENIAYMTKRARYALAWAVWVGVAAWASLHSPYPGFTGWDYVLFAFLVIVPKGIMGDFPAMTDLDLTPERKRRYVYTLITLGLFACLLSRHVSILDSPLVRVFIG
ncbi:hypothetical protein [Pseudomonas kurunegalensis]|uniref:hypothetical protein n=1 Tax=Pseudomonas kurunegalensis TaxID=485880 RepID=UPI00211865E0|nr:hypothetical protein [Pseudomonas kurunegalensis]